MRDELTIQYENLENRAELLPVRNSPAFARQRFRRMTHQSSRAGFTLIEMMIALSVFLLLMVVVFVPLTQAVSTFNAGRADIELQQSAQLTMNQIEAELQRAVYVYPNDVLPGVTDRLPYKNGVNLSNAPYYAGTMCDNTKRTGNTSRLDFLVGAMNPAGNQLAVPVRPENYIVTYYGRRVDETKEFDLYENPIGLFRAQMPYLASDNTTVPVGMNAASSRYAATACDAGWLTQKSHNVAGTPDEVDLEPYTLKDAGNVIAAHNLITPSGIGLPVPGVSTGGGAPVVTSLTPDLSFICADVNNDGKIDRVTVNLALEQYETSTSGGTNGKPRRHVVRLSQTIDLPNVR